MSSFWASVFYYKGIQDVQCVKGKKSIKIIVKTIRPISQQQKMPVCKQMNVTFLNNHIISLGKKVNCFPFNKRSELHFEMEPIIESENFLLPPIKVN